VWAADAGVSIAGIASSAAIKTFNITEPPPRIANRKGIWAPASDKIFIAHIASKSHYKTVLFPVVDSGKAVDQLVRFGSTVLQKSFCVTEDNFSGP
jgi:hypothetical protein